jgi:filamin
MLTNIGNNDIEEGSVKLTAAVLFKLMEHYQLGMGYQQAKKDLLAWVQKMIPDYNITGFSAKQWNDGRAVNAIINAVRGGLCKDHASLKTGSVTDREANWKSAMAVGLEKFKIPQLCDAEDLASDETDERSLVMYLSYYQHIPPSQAKETTCTVPTSAMIGVPMVFEVTMPKDDPCSEVKCNVTSATGKSAIETEYLGNGKFRCTYTPTAAGGNNVSVQVDGVEIPGGPFTVSVATVASLCTCTCPDKAVLAKPLEFEVRMPSGVGAGNLACSVKSGSGSSAITTEDLGGGRYKCSFMPTEAGTSEVSVKVDGVDVPGGPFSVKVDTFANQTTCKVPESAVVAMPITFEVRLPDENSGTLACSITQSNGTSLPIATKHLGGGKYSCSIFPTEAGNSKVSVKVDGVEVTDGPFAVEVDPLASKCRATGAGVEGKPETFSNAHFAVLIPTDPSSPPNDPARMLEVKVTGPDDAVEVTLTPKGNGEWHVDYTPVESGEHYVSVRVGGVGIPGSAFKVMCEMPNTLFAGWLDKQAPAPLALALERDARGKMPSSSLAAPPWFCRAPQARRARRNSAV